MPAKEPIDIVVESNFPIEQFLPSIHFLFQYLTSDQLKLVKSGKRSVRILLKGQNEIEENGVYTVSNTGSKDKPWKVVRG